MEMATLPEALSNNNCDTDDLDGKFARLVEQDRQWDLWAGEKLAAQHRRLWKRYWRLRDKLDAIESSPPDSVIDRRSHAIRNLRIAKELVIDRIIRTQELAKQRAQEFHALHRQNQILRGFLAPRPRRRSRVSVS